MVYRLLSIGIGLFGCLLLPVSGQAQSPHVLLREGDKAYLYSNYAESEAAYQEALKKDPVNEKAAYNLGNAQYRQGNYQGAEKAFQSAAQAADNSDRADALHNLGNALVQQEKYQEAIQAYQKSLRLRPGDAGSKRNLQLAKEKLREQQQQQQQSQSSQNQKQQQQEQQKGGQQQNQPPSSTTPPPSSSDQGNSQEPQKEEGGSRLPASRQQFLESIGREDQRNKRKYQEFNTSIKPRTRTKDW